MATTKARQSNIELLRIIAIMGVILLHYNNETCGAAFAFTQGLPVNHAICVVFEAMAICAVDVFVLISGYFLIDSDSRNIMKVVELVFQVILIKLGYNIITFIVQHDFSYKTLIKSFFPNNYFVILYSALYLISPLINMGLKKFSDQTKKKFLIICIILFSVWSFAVDILTRFTHTKWDGLSTVAMNGSGAGYTIVNFALMYLIGAYLRLFKDNIKIKTIFLIIAFVILVAIIFAGFYLAGSTFLYYNNPFVIAEAIVVFLIFSRINIGYKKWINELAKATFLCFLIHGYLLRYVFIQKFSTGNPLVQILHMLATAVVLYLFCWLIYKLYNLIFGPLFKKLSSIPKMKIDFRA